MQEVATIKFYDAENNDNAVIIVRRSPGVVNLCLSLESNGDVEACLNMEAVTALYSALGTCINSDNTENPKKK